MRDNEEKNMYQRLLRLESKSEIFEALTCKSSSSCRPKPKYSKNAILPIVKRPSSKKPAATNDAPPFSALTCSTKCMVGAYPSSGRACLKRLTLFVLHE